MADFPSGPIQRVEGRALVVAGEDIDTDRIIPARFLKCVSFDALGEQAFADDRKELEGAHPFDQPQFQGASILVVNGNFGCGSSREHAPQALMRWGIRAVVGVSFAEIFFGNCLALGIPCTTAAPDQVLSIQAAIQADPSRAWTLDLEEMKLALALKCQAARNMGYDDQNWEQLMDEMAACRFEGAEGPALLCDAIRQRLPNPPNEPKGLDPLPILVASAFQSLGFVERGL